ncbi:MAG: hypothetical protein ACLR6J_00095 [Parabacteroides merdae]
MPQFLRTGRHHRYLQIILVEKSNCNPTDILLQDRTLQLTVAGWFIVFALLIY